MYRDAVLVEVEVGLEALAVEAAPPFALVLAIAGKNNDIRGKDIGYGAVWY
jgi:hypothetical protein